MKTDSIKSNTGFDVGRFLNDKTEMKDGEKIDLIPLDRIRPNPFQPRKVFNKKALEELAADISSKGVTNPVIVRRLNGMNDEFELCAGERRHRASVLAGMTHIPAVIRDYNDNQMRTIANTENTQREDLLFMETMESYVHLKAELGGPAEVAQHVNKDPKTVGNYLRIHDAIYSHPLFIKIFEAQMPTVTFTVAKRFADVAADIRRLEKSNNREFNRIVKRMEKDGVAKCVEWVVEKISGKKRTRTTPDETNLYAWETETKEGVTLTIKLPKSPISIDGIESVRNKINDYMSRMEKLWEGVSQSPLKE